MSKRGFTLVELLVVLIVLGLLVAVALPRAFDAVQNAQRKACASNLRNLDSAVVVYRAEQGSWPSGIGDAQLLNYLKGSNLPTCPFGIAYALTAQNDETAKNTHFLNWPNIDAHQ